MDDDVRDWYGDLRLDGQGRPLKILLNVCTALRHAPEMAGNLRFDELRNRTVGRRMPWQPGEAWRDWTDADDLALTEWCQINGIMVQPRTCAEAVEVVAREDGFHPVREYLAGLKWDGERRIDDWLFRYFDAELSEEIGIEAQAAYVRAVGRRWLVAAVARAIRPGCKADAMLIIEGAQDLGKSTALKALVPVETWFFDSISDLGTKDSAQELQGKWIIEMAELSSLKRGEVERIKAFLSRTTDHYRPSYGRRAQDFDRHCVFAGTTNSAEFLMDHTGNRRYWPVKARKADVEGIRRDRDQLWAEACAAYLDGALTYLESLELKAIAAMIQAGKVVIDPWADRVMEFARMRLDLDDDDQPVHVRPNGQYVTTDDVLIHLKVPVERQTQIEANRVARIFGHAGWMKTRRRIDGRRVYLFLPKALAEWSWPGWTGSGGENGSGHGTEKTSGNQGPAPTVPGVPHVLGSAHIYEGTDSHDSQRVSEPTRDGGKSGTSLKTNGFSGPKPGHKPGHTPGTADGPGPDDGFDWLAERMRP